MNSKSIIEKIAAFIVDKRKGFYFAYVGIIIFCIISMKWVNVNNVLTDYLDKDTETSIGIEIMKNEFTTYASAKIMLDNISFERADSLAKELAEVEHVKEIAFDNTDAHYVNGSALFTVTFGVDSTDQKSLIALEEIKKKIADYDTYINADLGDSKAKTIQSEVNVVMLISALIIVSVLLLTSKTYMEIPVLIITFITAAILNKGTNFIFGTISYVSDSVAVVLQLALAIDYAIILCHRYTEERLDKEPREAVITALCKAIPEISGSCLTTISGLAAMTFMHFQIGFDLGIVLIKAIFLSILSVFTLMPGLLMSFSKLIDKSGHKSFIPQITFWGDFVVKLRFVAPPIFIILLIVGFLLSNKCPYAYSTKDLKTYATNESQVAEHMINSTFKTANTLALLVPKGDYDKEAALTHELEQQPEITSVKALSNAEAMDGYTVTSKLTPRQFAELTNMDIEPVNLIYSAYALHTESYGGILGGIDKYGIPLIDLFEYLYDRVNQGYFSVEDDLKNDLEEINDKLSDGKKQLQGENYSRIVLEMDIAEDGQETYQYLDKLRGIANKYYDSESVHMAGNSTNCYDLSSTFSKDNILISILSVLFVIIVLFFTFKSAGIPIILILVIQGSVWINFSFPYITNSPIFFMSYLVVSSIQMGANIDYAIVITNRYVTLREEMNAKEAAKTALVQAFPTIFTSGTILASAGFIIGFLSSDPAISSIGLSLGRGTLISIFLVMFILPQLLILGDKFIEKTSFSVKKSKTE